MSIKFEDYMASLPADERLAAETRGRELIAQSGESDMFTEIIAVLRRDGERMMSIERRLETLEAAGSKSPARPGPIVEAIAELREDGGKGLGDIADPEEYLGRKE